MKTNEILGNINSNGGFDNFRNWGFNEVKDWVKSNYDCSNFIARRVAIHLT